MVGKAVIDAQYAELETRAALPDVGGISPLNKHLQNEVRRTIKAVELVAVLQSHALLNTELSKTQIVAACKLLDKVVSNAPTEISGADGKPLAIGAVTREELFAEIVRGMAAEACVVASNAIDAAAAASK